MYLDKTLWNNLSIEGLNGLYETREVCDYNGKLKFYPSRTALLNLQYLKPFGITVDRRKLLSTEWLLEEGIEGFDQDCEIQVLYSFEIGIDESKDD